MSETFHSESAGLVRRNRWWLALGASPYVVGLMLLVTAFATGVWATALPIMHLTVFGSLGLMWAYRINKNPVTLPGGVKVDERGVHHAGRMVARRDELEAGFLTRNAGVVRVRLQRRGLRTSPLVSVRDVDDGRALLRALGFDATQTVGELRAASNLLTWSVGKQLLVLLGPVIGIAAMTGVLLGAQPLDGIRAGGVAGAVFALTVMTWIFGLTFAPTRVRVGVDGIATRWLGRERFIPLSRVKEVYQYEKRVGGKIYVGVEVTLDRGEHVKIPAGQRGFTVMDPSELEERIREALEIHREGGGAVDARLLARGSRGVGEWVTALRVLGSGANADMRTAPVPPEKLLRIAEDASAAPLIRAGAAVAARSTPEGRRRVRVAARAIASPALRVALERVAADETSDEAITEAIAELDAAEARADKASS